MSRQQISQLKPFLSILIFLMIMFAMVFLKMEVRRLGYSILKLSHEEKTMRDQNRMLEITIARYSRPERVEKIAQTKLTLHRARAGQIIQMTGERIALRQ